jgi:hypothetical protein
MTVGASVDGILVQWGERLFYPRTRIVRAAPLPRLDAMARRRAAEIRARIVATVTRRAPQVMVKVTGGGRGMAAIAAHLRYISKNGRLEMEDDRQMTHEGPDALKDIVEQWRYGGSLIGEASHRREAFNIMLSMPAGTRPDVVRMAAREFAQVELAGHRWLMVLHEHQANPHVHLSVRAEAINGDRLNPRKADLDRWRETFAEKLRGLGIDAEATRQATRGETRHYEALWRLKAKEEGRLRNGAQTVKSGDRHVTSRNGALEAWLHIVEALEGSDVASDRQLADHIRRFASASPYLREAASRRQQRAVSVERPAIQRAPQPVVTRGRADPEIER